MANGAGPLNKRVTFQNQTQTRNADGDIVYQYEPVSDALTRHPALFRPERGWEREEAERQQSSVRGTLKVRSSSATRSVTPDMVVILHETHGDVIYNIDHGVNADQHDRYIMFTIESGKATR